MLLCETCMKDISDKYVKVETEKGEFCFCFRCAERRDLRVIRQKSNNDNINVKMTYHEQEGD